MARTTIRLDDDLLAHAKQRAAETGRTLTALISDALRQALAGTGDAGPAQPVRLTTFGGDGVMPGVDLTDRRARRDLRDGTGGSSRT